MAAGHRLGSDGTAFIWAGTVTGNILQLTNDGEPLARLRDPLPGFLTAHLDENTESLLTMTGDRTIKCVPYGPPLSLLDPTASSHIEIRRELSVSVMGQVLGLGVSGPCRLRVLLRFHRAHVSPWKVRGQDDLPRIRTAVSSLSGKGKDDRGGGGDGGSHKESRVELKATPSAFRLTVVWSPSPLV